MLIIGSKLHSFAQLLESDTARISYALGSSLYLSRGNVDRFLWRNEVSVKHIRKEIGLSTENTYIYGTFGGRQTENDISSRNFLYLTPKNSMYPYMMLWIESHFRKQIDLRYQIGPGISWNVWEKPEHLIKLSLTGTYEVSDFDGSDFQIIGNQNSSVISTWRLTGRIYASHHLLQRKLNMMWEIWYQPSIESIDNYRYNIHTLWQVPISKSLYFFLRLDYSYEHVALVRISQDDLIWTVGFNFKR